MVSGLVAPLTEQDWQRVDELVAIEGASIWTWLTKARTAYMANGIFASGGAVAVTTH
jgi:hypothetical protein